MTVVTVSPTYQVVIPKDGRERLQLKPGQKLATARSEGAEAWTQDADFRDLSDVRFVSLEE